jgi:hypothetical protein
MSAISLQLHQISIKFRSTLDGYGKYLEFIWSSYTKELHRQAKFFLKKKECSY